MGGLSIFLGSQFLQTESKVSLPLNFGSYRFPLDLVWGLWHERTGGKKELSDFPILLEQCEFPFWLFKVN